MRLTRQMDSNGQNEQIRLLQIIELLDKGQRLNDPFLRTRVEKALRGNPVAFYDYLKNHPDIVKTAEATAFINERLHELNPFYPFPLTSEEVSKLSGPLELGYYNPFKNIFGINPQNLNLNTIVVGRTRSGKSNLNLIALSQLFNQTDLNIIIIDIKKEYRCLLPYHPNLKVITFKNIRFNPLEVPPWEDPKDHINTFAEVFCRENFILAFGKNMLISAIEYLYKERGILNGKKTGYPTFKDLYYLINAQKGAGRVADSKATLLSRLKPYIDYPEIFCGASFPFDTWLQNHLSIELENVTNEMYATIANLIVSLIYNYYHKMNLRGSRTRTLFVVDEAGVLFNASRDKNINFGDSYINTLVRRGGEFNIGFWVTSQEPATLSQAIHSNSILKFMFPLVEAQQLRIMASSMALTEEQMAFTFKLPVSGTCIVRYGYFPQAFILDVPLFGKEKAVSDEFVEQRMQSFYKEITPVKKSSEPVQVQQEVEVPKPQIPEDALALLHQIAKNPFDNFTTHRGQSKLGEHAVDRARKWLTEEDYIRVEEIKITKSRGRTSSLLVLEKKALNLLGIQQHLGKGSFKHQIYCHLIQKHLEQDGWKAKVEAAVYPSNKLIDVVAKKQGQTEGYEVTLHLENLLENIEKDLQCLHRLFIVVEKKDLKKANAVLADFMSHLSPDKEVQIKTIDEFFLESKEGD